MGLISSASFGDLADILVEDRQLRHAQGEFGIGVIRVHRQHLAMTQRRFIDPSLLLQQDRKVVECDGKIRP